MVVDLDARCKKIEMFVGAHAVNVVLVIYHRYVGHTLVKCVFMTVPNRAFVHREHSNITGTR